jgi:DUF1365 family protein
MLDLDVASLPYTGVSRWLLGVDGLGLLTVRTTSFLERARLDGGGGGILDRVHWLCRQLGFESQGHRISVITFPQLCGYTFNPVHFYLVSAASGELAYLISEVHNTFGEVHPYGARPVSRRYEDGEEFTEFQFPKVFFVSPFLAVSGTYTVLVRRCHDDLDITVQLEQEHEPVFSAGMRGTVTPLSTRSLGCALLRLPWGLGLTMVRISLQALWLIKKRVAVHSIPRTIKEDFVRNQSVVEKLRFWALVLLTKGRFRRE